MYAKCQDSFSDSINSPLCSSTKNSFSNAAFLLNSIPESIVIISEKGIILEINTATSRLFGWTKDEIINRKNISFLLTNRDGEKLMNIINSDEIISLADSIYHYHGLNKNGSTFPCEISFGVFPKSLLDNNLSSSSSINQLSNTTFIAVISANKKIFRSSDSVLLDLKSRYQNEYDEIETLGKGGFGQVYKARNRLDGQLYAIKKIKLQSKPNEYSSSFDLQAFENLKSINSNNITSTSTSNLPFLSAEDLRIVREVKTFARISNHPNIVRYHASWIEVEEKVPKKKKSIHEDSDNDDSSSDEDDDNSDESDNESEEGFEDRDIPNIQNIEDSFSYSNNNSLDNNVDYHSHESSNCGEVIINSNVPDSNDFIITFDDTQNNDDLDNNMNANNDNNNANDFCINMNDLDSLRSDKSDDDFTNINSSEETSYNQFSFRPINDSIMNNQSNLQNSLSSTSHMDKTQKKKGKNIGLDPINTSVIKPLEKQNNLRLFLIIQMELCSGQTLETWIRERNQLAEKKEIHIDRKVIFKIFKQIVQAIAHVHWNGCIHRDVKPANVFLQDDNHILLGDFGLAKDVDFTVTSPKSETLPFSTTLINNEDEVDLSIENRKDNRDGETEVTSAHHNLTSGVGTYIYASPEQLASSQGYDNKTDIYSLGILLFELLWPFKTGMERIKTLTNIRNGKFPENFVEKWPLELPFLRSLLNPDPALRPTAQDILDSEVLNINYITPLYNNPTNLLNALDLRVTRVTFDPNESIALNNRLSSKERKGHNKTLSTASKSIKNYGDCGACKQKDMAISSFRNQFIKTKVTIADLEESVARASKRVWVISIITFFVGCIITLGVTFLVLNRGGGFYDTSSIQSVTPGTIDTKASIDNHIDFNNNNNIDSSVFVSETKPEKIHSPNVHKYTPSTPKTFDNLENNNKH